MKTASKDYDFDPALSNSERYVCKVSYPDKQELRDLELSAHLGQIQLVGYGDTITHFIVDLRGRTLN